MPCTHICFRSSFLALSPYSDPVPKVGLKSVTICLFCSLSLRRTKELSQWSVVLGQTYITLSGAVSVESIVINHAYNSVSHDYDVAMVRLASDVLPGGVDDVE